MTAATKKRRQPFKSLQQQADGDFLNDADAKVALGNALKKRVGNKMHSQQENNEDSGLIDKIEQMLEKGNYRMGSTRSPRRGVVSKGNCLLNNIL